MAASWVFTAHREHRDRQSSAVVEGNMRRQAASTSPCHAILSLLVLQGKEKDRMVKIWSRSVGCVQLAKPSLLFLREAPEGKQSPSHSTARKWRLREVKWEPKAKDQRRLGKC